MTLKILHLHVKKKYFDDVANGKKEEEYRSDNDYWKKKLNQDYDLIKYHCGYPKKTDKSRTMVFHWNNSFKKFITHELFGEKVIVNCIPLNNTTRLKSMM